MTKRERYMLTAIDVELGRQLGMATSFGFEDLADLIREAMHKARSMHDKEQTK